MPSLWQHRDFRRLWAAQAISAVGSRITRTALPIIAINSLGASATAVAVLSALTMAPGVAVALFAAGYIDRAPKRPLLIAMDLARACLLLSLPVAGLLGLLTMVHLIVVATLTGAATAIFLVAEQAYLPRLVEAPSLFEGNTKLQVSEAVAEIAGPSAAGFLIQALTAPIAVIADALSFVWSAWWLRQIRVTESVAPQAARTHPLEDILEGWRVCRGHRIVFPLLLAQTSFGIFSGFFATIYMIFTLRTLGLDEATVGVIIGVGGVGALSGAFAANRLARVLGYGRAIVLCLAAWIVASALIPAAEWHHQLTVPFLVGQQLIGDGFLSAFMILTVSVRQTALDTDVLARAGATFQFAGGLALPIGALIAGLLAEIVGTGAVLWIAIIGSAIPLLVLARSPMASLKKLEDLQNLR